MSPEARQAKSKARIKAYEEMAAEQHRRRDRGARNPDSARQAPGRLVVEAKNLSKALRRPPADREPQLPPAARRHRRHHRPQRRRQDDAVPHDHGPGDSPTAASFAIGERSSWATSIRTATRSSPTRPSTKRSPAGTTRSKWASRKMNARAYVARFNFHGPDQQKKVGDPLRRRAEPRPPGQAAAPRLQRAAARRTDERPRRRHAAGPGRSDRSTSPAAWWSSATIAGSSTASPRTSWRSKATATSTGAKATSRPTKSSATNAWAKAPTSRSASAIRNCSTVEGSSIRASHANLAASGLHPRVFSSSFLRS